MSYMFPYGPNTPNYPSNVPSLSRPNTPYPGGEDYMRRQPEAKLKAADQCRLIYEQYKNKLAHEYSNTIISKLKSEAAKGNTFITIENFQDELHKDHHEILLRLLKLAGFTAEIYPVDRGPQVSEELELRVSFISF